MSIKAMKQALEVLEDFVDDPRAQHQIDAASAALRQAIAVYESAPPECQTDAEKTAYAFGWWKAMEAQQAEKQEPVAHLKLMMEHSAWEGRLELSDALANIDEFYTHSQQKREWVGLTDEDLEPLCNEWRIVFGSWTYEFAKAIEAKLKAKNGY